MATLTAISSRMRHPVVQDMQQAPSARFYRAVGQLGEQFMAVEGQAFRMSLPPAAEIKGGRSSLV